jgi:hypothetical protein
MDGKKKTLTVTTYSQRYFSTYLKPDPEKKTLLQDNVLCPILSFQKLTFLFSKLSLSCFVVLLLQRRIRNSKKKKKKKTHNKNTKKKTKKNTLQKP